MAVSADNDPARLESEFLSGKNPLAYIPLCHSLRRQKKYARALEICQRGLAGDASSVAGRVLFARILADVGRFKDALEEITRLETRAPDAMGVMVEKARCLLHLRRLDEAAVVLKALDERNPHDPQVQMLHTQLIQARNKESLDQAPRRSSAGIPRSLLAGPRQMLEEILREVKPLGEVVTLAIVPLKAGEPVLEGEPGPAECAYQFYKESTQAARELDCGGMRIGLLETDRAQLIVLVRRDHLVAFCTRPTQNFGKVLYRLQMVVGRLMPEADIRGTPEDTRPDENDTIVED